MGLFSKRKKKTDADAVAVAEKKQSTLRDTAAATAFAEAGEHETAVQMLRDAADRKKILVVGHEDSFSTALVDYAIDMAKRMSFEIVALNVTDAPFALPKNRQEEAKEAFTASCRDNVQAFQARAEEAGIAFEHRIEFGDQDRIIEKIHAVTPGLRFVVTEPDPEVARQSNGKVAIPVFGMNGIQGAAA